MQREVEYKVRFLLFIADEESCSFAGNDLTWRTDVIMTADLGSLTANEISMSRSLPAGSERKQVKVAQFDATATKLMTMSKRKYVVQVQCSSTNDNNGHWYWNYQIFSNRFFLMRSMYEDYTRICVKNFFQLNSLYPSCMDPFLDVPVDEVIGVACVYLNSLYYLIDIDDAFPIVNFAGYTSGNVRVTVRGWIDKIETIPSYITVDREVTLNDFINRTLIIRININSLQDIPEHLSTGTYITFKFFYHSKVYQTPRYCGKTTTPYIKGVIAIEQKITVDFIDSIKTGYIDMEVIMCVLCVCCACLNSYIYIYLCIFL